MDRFEGEPSTLGWFALVSYIPEPLARFLDDLRLELTPDSRPHAHVTVLPPRPQHQALKTSLDRISRGSRAFTPFRVELDQIEIFEASSVIYVGLASGVAELRSLYEALNSDCLRFREGFPYHPHVTIAQDLDPGTAPNKVKLAKERWAQYQGPRSFEVSVLSFVQHVAPQIWMDVGTMTLGQSVARAS